MNNQSVFSYPKPETSPGYCLWKTTINWQRRIKKALEPFEVSHAQFVILASLRWFEENQLDATQVNIVAQSGLDKMTVSKSLRRLATVKLVQRVEHSEDTRAKLVSLTTKGEKLIQQLVQIVEAIDRDFFGTLSKEDEKTLLKLLDQLMHI